jgi:PiT family inorganic phosphate transporter
VNPIKYPPPGNTASSPSLAFIVIVPLIGRAAAFAMITAVYWLFQKSKPLKLDTWFRKLQLLSGAGLSFSHGTNDAQKTMGIITECW